jgi:hypothetical protein
MADWNLLAKVEDKSALSRCSSGDSAACSVYIAQEAAKGGPKGTEAAAKAAATAAATAGCVAAATGATLGMGAPAALAVCGPLSAVVVDLVWPAIVSVGAAGKTGLQKLGVLSHPQFAGDEYLRDLVPVGMAAYREGCTAIASAAGLAYEQASAVVFEVLTTRSVKVFELPPGTPRVHYDNAWWQGFWGSVRSGERALWDPNVGDQYAVWQSPSHGESHIGWQMQRSPGDGWPWTVYAMGWPEDCTIDDCDLAARTLSAAAMQDFRMVPLQVGLQFAAARVAADKAVKQSLVWGGEATQLEQRGGESGSILGGTLVAALAGVGGYYGYHAWRRSRGR